MDRHRSSGRFTACFCAVFETWRCGPAGRLVVVDKYGHARGSIASSSRPRVGDQTPSKPAQWLSLSRNESWRASARFVYGTCLCNATEMVSHKALALCLLAIQTLLYFAPASRLTSPHPGDDSRFPVFPEQPVLYFGLGKASIIVQPRLSSFSRQKAGPVSRA